MAKKIIEEKLAELMQQAMDNHWFNANLFADLLVDENLYYQDKLNELVEAIIAKQAKMYERQWEQGYTTDGLMRSSYIQDVIEARDLNASKIKLK